MARHSSHRYLLEALEARTYLAGVVFAAPQILDAGALKITPACAILAHVFSNNRLDLVVTNKASGVVGNSVSILPGNGDGTFGAPRTIPLDFVPQAVVAGPLAEGGRTGLIVGSASNNSVAVLVQNADQTFHEDEYLASPLNNTRSLAAGDFNGDGALDFAVVSYELLFDSTAIFLNDGTGHFALQQTLWMPHPHLSSVTSFAAGGRTHLVVTDQDANNITVIRNDGDGHFTPGGDYRTGTSPVGIQAGQFNSTVDSNEDLVTANFGGGDVSVLLGDRYYSFRPAISRSLPDIPQGSGPMDVRVASFSKPGSDDLIALLHPASTTDAAILLNEGDGTFRVGGMITAGVGGRNSLAAGDLNGDNLTDVVIVSPAQVYIFLNDLNHPGPAPTAAVSVSQPAQRIGSTSMLFSVTYSDSRQIDATTLSDANVIVTDPAGRSWPVTLVSTDPGNGSCVTATYSIAAPSGPLAPADYGTYLVTTTSDPAHAVQNAWGEPVAGGTAGTFHVQFTTPAAAVDIAQPPQSAGSQGIHFTVTYTDTTPIDTSTIDGGGVVVTDPGGNTHFVTLSTYQIASPSRVTVTYWLDVPSGSLWAADYGTYVVSATSDINHAVNNASGIPVAPGQIGTLTVPNAASSGGPNLSVQSVRANLPASVMAGTKSRTPVRVTLINKGDAPASGPVEIRLYAWPQGSAQPLSPQLVSLRKNINLKAGKTLSLTLPAFNWPQYVDADCRLVAYVNPTQTLSETSTADNFTTTSNSAAVAMPFANLKNLWNGRAPKLIPGARIRVPVLLKNTGNVSARGSATFTLQGGSAPAASAVAPVNIPAGKTKTVNVSFTLPDLDTGVYRLTLTALLPADANPADNTVTSDLAFTV